MATNRIHVSGEYEYGEATAATATIYPGMLCYIASTGKLTLHATEGGAAGDENLFLLEDALQGKTVSDSTTAGAKVGYLIGRPGVVVQGLIKAGEDIAIGDKLVSGADGTLVESTNLSTGETANRIVGVAMEACDLTATGASNTLAKIRLV